MKHMLMGVGIYVLGVFMTNVFCRIVVAKAGAEDVDVVSDYLAWMWPITVFVTIVVLVIKATNLLSKHIANGLLGSSK